MGVFINQGNVVLQWAAKHSIETSKESKLLSDAASDQKQSLLKQEMESKEVASSIKQMQQTVQIGMDGVKIAESSQSLGKTVSSQQTAKQNMPALRDNLRAVRDNPGDEAAMQRLKDTPLENGRTVGDRFSDDQLRVLTGQDTNLSADHLHELGFTDSDVLQQTGEVDDLVKAGKDGLNNDEAVGFMMAHRKTSSEMKGEYVRQKLQEAINTNVDTLVGTTAEWTRRSVQQGGKQAKSAVSQADKLFSDILEGDTQHLKELDKNRPRLPPEHERPQQQQPQELIPGGECYHAARAAHRSTPRCWNGREAPPLSITEGALSAPPARTRRQRGPGAGLSLLAGGDAAGRRRPLLRRDLRREVRAGARAR